VEDGSPRLDSSHEPDASPVVDAANDVVVDQKAGDASSALPCSGYTEVASGGYVASVEQTGSGACTTSASGGTCSVAAGASDDDSAFIAYRVAGASAVCAVADLAWATAAPLDNEVRFVSARGVFATGDVIYEICAVDGAGGRLFGKCTGFGAIDEKNVGLTSTDPFRVAGYAMRTGKMGADDLVQADVTLYKTTGGKALHEEGNPGSSAGLTGAATLEVRFGVAHYKFASGPSPATGVTISNVHVYSK
jgi:hypothetical protein